MTGSSAGPGDADGEPRTGLLVVDKPGGWSSHDVVGRVRRLAGTRKVGHAGTLDPMATGVLVLGVERATRLLTYLVGLDKEYEATIRLGQSTMTDDAEGELTGAPGAVGIDRVSLERAVDALTGAISQVPSTVSAIKVAGRRSYSRVRAGEEVALAARAVVVERFEVLACRPAVAADGTAVTDVDVAVACSSGTYIRALARDLGAALGTGGHLTALRRTRVGPFTLADAVPLEELDAGAHLIDATAAARRCFPVRQLSAEEERSLRFGRSIGPGGTGERPVAALGPEGRVVALVVDRPSVGERPERAQPVLVLEPA